MLSRPASFLASVVLLAVPPLLAGCGGTKPAQASASLDPANGGAGDLLSPSGGLLDTGRRDDPKNQQGATSLGVNAYLWRGALDTLSFMPLASADPFGGVIITDWYQPPATPGERFKATAYILGRQLRADGIRVAIFRQTLQGGQWVDADLAPDTVTDIENKVLARARELRAQPSG